MSDPKLEKKWTRWYPKKIFLKNKEQKQKILSYLDKFREEDFFIDLKNKEKYGHIAIDVIEKKEYKLGFQAGLLEGTKENSEFKNELNNLFLSFDSALCDLENIMCSRILTIVLKISSYVVGKNIDFDQEILIQKIKKIINKENNFLKQTQLIINPKNKILIQKTFKDFLKTSKWTLLYDENIELNGCKIKLDNSYFDTTLDARWQEVCRLLYSEEY